MTTESAALISIVVLFLTAVVWLMSVRAVRTNSFFAYIGSFAKHKIDREDANLEIRSDFSPTIILATCFFVLLLGVFLNKFYDRWAYGGIESMFFYEVQVRHDFERARSDLKSMQLELEELKQNVSQRSPPITAADAKILGRCEEIRVHQLTLQGELVRIKGEIARRGLMQNDSEAILPKVEIKLNRLEQEISDISNVCATIGKVGRMSGEGEPRKANQ
jgi:hypothetical protein